MDTKYAIYSRKSKFTGKGESIENQIELCKQYILLSDPQVKVEDIFIYEDEGFSGGNIQRPKFKEMMKDAGAKKFNTIVCYRLDRISRNISDFAQLVKEFENLNISFESVKEKFDTTSSLGRAMMYISSIFSQLERETIAERIRDNMYELAKTGRWLGGTPPTGFKSIPIEKVTIDGKTRTAYKLSKIDEIETVMTIFSKFMELDSLTKTETYLLQNGYKTRNGKAFTRFSIKAILQNPVYMIADEDARKFLLDNNIELPGEFIFDNIHGIIAYNKTLQKAGSANETRDISDWIFAIGKHEGTVPGADWVKVQKMLDMNKSKAYRKVRSHVALLSGLLYCGNCNSYMRPKMSQRLNKNGEVIYDYLCEIKEKSKGQLCDVKRPNGNTLDDLVCEEIKKLSENSSEFIKQLERVKKIILETNDGYENQLAALRTSLAENESEIKYLVMSLAKTPNEAVMEYITKQIEEIHSKNVSIKQNIEDFENLSQKHDLSLLEFDILKDMLSSFEKTFDTMSIKQKRAALKVFVKKVIWDGENIHIILFGSEGNI